MAKKGRPKSSAPPKAVAAEDSTATASPSLAFLKWSSVDITAEKWNNDTKGGKGDKTKFPYDDPCGFVPLPKSLLSSVHRWERASASTTLGEKLCMLSPEHSKQVDAFTGKSKSEELWLRKKQLKLAPKTEEPWISLTQSNEHLMNSPLMREIITALSYLQRPPRIHDAHLERAWELIHPQTPGVSETLTPATPTLNHSGGKYVVKLFFHNEWRRVVVDDFLPFTADGKCLLPISSHNELWPAVLAKAVLRLAALSMTYLEGADPAGEAGGFDVVACLTGWVGVSRTVQVEHKDKQRQLIDLLAELRPASAIPTVVTTVPDTPPAEAPSRQQDPPQTPDATAPKKGVRRSRTKSSMGKSATATPMPEPDVPPPQPKNERPKPTNTMVLARVRADCRKRPANDLRYDHGLPPHMAHFVNVLACHRVALPTETDPVTVIEMESPVAPSTGALGYGEPGDAKGWSRSLQLALKINFERMRDEHRHFLSLRENGLSHPHFRFFVTWEQFVFNFSEIVVFHKPALYPNIVTLEGHRGTGITLARALASHTPEHQEHPIPQLQPIDYRNGEPTLVMLDTAVPCHVLFSFAVSPSVVPAVPPYPADPEAQELYFQQLQQEKEQQQGQQQEEQSSNDVASESSEKRGDKGSAGSRALSAHDNSAEANDASETGKNAAASNSPLQWGRLIVSPYSWKGESSSEQPLLYARTASTANALLAFSAGRHVLSISLKVPQRCSLAIMSHHDVSIGPVQAILGKLSAPSALLVAFSHEAKDFLTRILTAPKHTALQLLLMKAVNTTSEAGLVPVDLVNMICPKLIDELKPALGESFKEDDWKKMVDIVREWIAECAIKVVSLPSVTIVDDKSRRESATSDGKLERNSSVNANDASSASDASQRSQHSPLVVTGENDEDATGNTSSIAVTSEDSVQHPRDGASDLSAEEDTVRESQPVSPEGQGQSMALEPAEELEEKIIDETDTAISEGESADKACEEATTSFPEDNEETTAAAVKIQAHVRGFLARTHLQQEKERRILALRDAVASAWAMLGTSSDDSEDTAAQKTQGSSSTAAHPLEVPSTTGAAANAANRKLVQEFTKQNEIVIATTHAVLKEAPHLKELGLFYSCEGSNVHFQVKEGRADVKPQTLVYLFNTPLVVEEDCLVRLELRVDDETDEARGRANIFSASTSVSAGLRIFDAKARVLLPACAAGAKPTLLRAQEEGYIVLGYCHSQAYAGAAAWKLQMMSDKKLQPDFMLSLLPPKMDDDLEIPVLQTQRVYKSLVTMYDSPTAPLHLDVSLLRSPEASFHVKVKANDMVIAKAEGRSRVFIPFLCSPLSADNDGDPSHTEGADDDRNSNDGTGKRVRTGSARSMANRSSSRQGSAKSAKPSSGKRGRSSARSASKHAQRVPQQTFEIECTLVGKLSAPVNDDEQSASSRAPSGKRRVKSSGRSTSAKKGASPTNPCLWLRVATSDDLDIFVDEREENKIKKVILGWEAAEAGRGEKAKAAREKHVDSVAVDDAALTTASVENEHTFTLLSDDIIGEREKDAISRMKAFREQRSEIVAWSDNELRTREERKTQSIEDVRKREAEKKLLMGSASGLRSMYRARVLAKIAAEEAEAQRLAEEERLRLEAEASSKKGGKKGKK